MTLIAPPARVRLRFADTSVITDLQDLVNISSEPGVFLLDFEQLVSCGEVLSIQLGEGQPLGHKLAGSTCCRRQSEKGILLLCVSKIKKRN